MLSAVNTCHWTQCLYWGLNRVCVRGTLPFTQSYTSPHIRQMLLGRRSQKKKLCFVCLFVFLFWSSIFSHGDVYQYLRELGGMGLFFLMLYLNLWYHSSLPICQMLSCDPVGWMGAANQYFSPSLKCWAFFLQREIGLILIISVCINKFKVFFLIRAGLAV